MKTARNGKAKVLTHEELNLLFEQGFTTQRDRALFGICLYTGCRIAEACALHTADVYSANGKPKTHITIRKGTTKGKLETRVVPICDELREILLEYESSGSYLFPSRHGSGHIRSDSADKILRSAFKQLGIEGASTHSFRRTALTRMHSQGIPLKIICSISGHRSLDVLQRYLEVDEEDKKKAITTLNFMRPKN
jgi:integrase/recombinase XerD